MKHTTKATGNGILIDDDDVSQNGGHHHVTLPSSSERHFFILLILFAVYVCASVCFFAFFTSELNHVRQELLTCPCSARESIISTTTATSASARDVTTLGIAVRTLAAASLTTGTATTDNHRTTAKATGATIAKETTPENDENDWGDYLVDKDEIIKVERRNDDEIDFAFDDKDNSGRHDHAAVDKIKDYSLSLDDNLDKTISVNEDVGILGRSGEEGWRALRTRRAAGTAQPPAVSDEQAVTPQIKKNRQKHGNTQNNRNRELNGNRKQQKQLQGTPLSSLSSKVIAAHYTAPPDFSRQYESGSLISFGRHNASNNRDAVYRFWKLADWVDPDVDKLYYLDETTGLVTVEETGLYLVYAQVVYHDLTGRWSFGIYVADTEKVKCLVTEQLRDLTQYDKSSHGVYQHCYTAQVMYIKKNQSVSIRCMYGSRKILTKPEFTFWGIVKL